MDKRVQRILPIEARAGKVDGNCLGLKLEVNREYEAPRPQGWASRARSGEQNASQGNLIFIVPLDPAYKAGLAGHLPAKWGDLILGRVSQE